MMNYGNNGPMLSPEQTRVQPWFAIGGDENLRLEYPLNKDSLVYDVGAYLGEWAEPIYEKYHCTIEAFEPVQEFVDRLHKKFKNNPKIHIHDFGLAGSNKTMKITLEDASSSVFKTADSEEEIKLVAVDKIMDSNAKIDLMKINIEGGEYELLEKLVSTGLIKNIRDIQVQFHIFVPGAQAKRQKIREALSNSHTLTYSYPWIWENWRLK